MYLEKAKPEEFEAYYQIKCEPFVNYWSRGDNQAPPRENLRRFYQGCTSADHRPPAKEIYLIKTDAGETAGYLYIEAAGDSVDLPIAVSGRFARRGYGRQAILQGLRIARERGYRRSKVEIREDNAASIRLYTSCGYRRGEKTRDMYSAALGQHIALYAYRREVGETDGTGE